MSTDQEHIISKNVAVCLNAVMDERRRSKYQKEPKLLCRFVIEPSEITTSKTAAE